MSKDKYPFGLTKEQFDASIQHALEETDRCQAEILGYKQCVFCKKYKYDVSLCSLTGTNVCNMCVDKEGINN